MAKIVSKERPWKAVIRCAHPVCYGLYRVDGCFALFEIGLEDIDGSRDWEGDWTFWVTCPNCGQKLYPEWQIGDRPLEAVKERILNRKRK